MNAPFRRSRLSMLDFFAPPCRPGPVRDLGAPSLPTPLDLFDGLEVNELDSESVFDKFFGQPVPKKR